MHLSILISVSLIITTVGLSAQTTIALQPDAEAGKDAQIWSNNPGQNYGANPSNMVYAWTNQSVPGVKRSLFAFDLSTVPVDAFIRLARLTLYHDPNTDDASGNHTGDNPALIQRIVSSWEEMEVNWNNQPSTTSVNETHVPASYNGTHNYTNIDVTNLVLDMLADPENSYGFMIRLQDEEFYRSIVLASSDHENAALHPRLEITYTFTECIALQPDVNDGKDTEIWNNNSGPSHGAYEQMVAYAWTNQSVPGTKRVLIDFDLSSVPSDFDEVNAHLSLYHNPTTEDATGLHSGSNASYLRRITEPWDEMDVTWNSAPATTSVNQVSLAETPYPTYHYLDVDVSQLVMDMLSDPAASHGFMLKLQDEEFYKGIVLAASEHPYNDLHPRLTICWTTSTATEQHAAEKACTVYPNPGAGIFQIDTGFELRERQVKVLNAVGQFVPFDLTQRRSGATLTLLDGATGLYVLTISEGPQLIHVQKLAVAR